MNGEKYDCEIRRIAQSGDVQYPSDFDAKMRKLFESLPEDDGDKQDDEEEDRHGIRVLRIMFVYRMYI